MMKLFPRSWSDLGHVLTTAQYMLYPPRCAGCNQEHPEELFIPICDSCLATIEPCISNDRPPCLALGRHVGPLQHIIRRFKYGESMEAVSFLSRVLGHVIKNSMNCADAIVSVPSSSRSLEIRGFNPARYIATIAAEYAGIPLLTQQAIVKTRETSKQAWLSINERKHNVRNAFRTQVDLRNCSVIVIDDVLTTGSTLRAMIDALEDAGGKIIGAAFLTMRPLFVLSSGSAWKHDYSNSMKK